MYVTLPRLRAPVTARNRARKADTVTISLTLRAPPACAPRVTPTPIQAANMSTRSGPRVSFQKAPPAKEAKSTTYAMAAHASSSATTHGKSAVSRHPHASHHPCLLSACSTSAAHQAAAEGT